MRTTAILFILLAFCLSLNAQNQKSQRFAIKSGYVKYELTGNTTGTKTVWWDDYGDKTRTEEKTKTVTKMFGMKNEEEKHLVTVIVKDKYWSADYKDKRGSKGTLAYYNEGKEFAESMTKEEQEKFADDILASFGGEKLGKENVLGKSCDVMKVMGAKIWVHKGITLKSEAKVLGITTNEKATEFKPGSVSSSKFSPPSGIEYEDIDARQQEAFGGMNQMFEGMQGAMQEEEEEDNDVPVEYPFDKFKKVVSGFSHNGYKKIRANSAYGKHACIFTKALVKNITVVATSRKNSTDDHTANYEKFTHNGKTCYYGDLEDDEEGTALIVEYPKYDMYIIIASTPSMDKGELIKISDKLSF